MVDKYKDDKTGITCWLDGSWCEIIDSTGKSLDYGNTIAKSAKGVFEKFINKR